MRTVVVLMMIIILLNVLPQLWSRFYLIRTGSGEDQSNQEGQDYAGLDDDSVLDCTTTNNYFCRHIAQLFNKKKREKEQKIIKE